MRYVLVLFCIAVAGCRAPQESAPSKPVASISKEGSPPETILFPSKYGDVTFTHKKLNLDLRYYGTNLSKENCFVFTGDPNARPGGRVDLVINPAGLTSNWCGATVVAKAWFAF